ncbi:MAG: hypothetical protein ACXVAM_18225 [Vulcanimicrobiaceae bacterium]
MPLSLSCVARQRGFAVDLAYLNDVLGVLQATIPSPSGIFFAQANKLKLALCNILVEQRLDEGDDRPRVRNQPRIALWACAEDVLSASAIG